MRVLLWSGIRQLWLLLACVAVIAIPVQATTVIIPSDDELIIGSRAIVKGQVTSIGSSYDPDERGFFTYVTLRVSEVLKGQIITREIVLKEPGGIAGGFGSKFFGVPQFTVDEQVLLYLDTWQDGSLRVYQWFMGKFTIERDASSGQMITSRAPAEGGVSVLGRSTAGPSTVSHGDRRLYHYGSRTYCGHPPAKRRARSAQLPWHRPAIDAPSEAQRPR